MKIIAKRFYYQQKNWEFNDIKRQVHEEESRMSPEEKEESVRNHQLQLEHLHTALQEREAATKYLPAPILFGIFRRSIAAALSVAEHFDMNIVVESDDHRGIIRFVTDQIISERMWKDQKYRKQLLRLMKWSDGLWIDPITEDDQHLIQLSLTYRIVRATVKK